MQYFTDQLDASVPVTFIYGARSWMDISSGHRTKEILKDSDVEVYVSTYSCIAVIANVGSIGYYW